MIDSKVKEFSFLTNDCINTKAVTCTNLVWCNYFQIMIAVRVDYQIENSTSDILNNNQRFYQ